ncbi:hypothetical protein PLESTB_000788800, partial [Pleodorina starrii]
MTGPNEGRMSSSNNGIFPDLRVASMHPETGAIGWETAHNARLVITRAGDAAPVIQLENQASGSPFVQCVLSNRTAWRAGVALFFVSPLPGGAGGMSYAVQCPSKAAADQLQAALEAALAAAPTPAAAAAAASAAAPADSSRDANGHSNGRANGAPATTATAPGTVAGLAAPRSPGPHWPPPSPAVHGSGGAAGREGAPAAAAAVAAAAGSGPGPGLKAAGVGAAAAASGAEDGSRAGPGPPNGVAAAQDDAAAAAVVLPPRSPCHPGTAHAAAAAGTAAPGPGQQQQQQSSASGDHGDAGGGGAEAAELQNHFDRKICRASSDMYFHYYGMLQHQQNMLQDYTRTGTYYTAILGNPDDFRGRTVLDVGAGSGILSLFAAAAGAARVYAVEASGMARFARALADANPGLGSRITVINSKVEEVTLPERVDVLVSEPMGTLLVNERMLESYIYARDAFLKPGGKMFPQLGRIHVAAFSDEVLHSEVAAKAAFWMQPSFYGVDVTCLHAPAAEGYFGQVVVDAFDPALLVSSCASRALDFGSMPESELLDIDMPLQLVTGPVAPLTIHGLACWFDVFFAGAQQPVWLTTAPGMPTTHWFQLRCVLQQPLLVTSPNTRITGRLHLVAHARQSYDIFLTLTAPPLQPGGPPQTSSGKFDLKEPYYRQLTPYGAAAATMAGAAAQGVGADGGAVAA